MSPSPLLPAQVLLQGQELYGLIPRTFACPFRTPFIQPNSTHRLQGSGNGVLIVVRTRKELIRCIGGEGSRNLLESTLLVLSRCSKWVVMVAMSPIFSEDSPLYGGGGRSSL